MSRVVLPVRHLDLVVVGARIKASALKGRLGDSLSAGRVARFALSRRRHVQPRRGRRVLLLNCDRCHPRRLHDSCCHSVLLDDRIQLAGRLQGFLSNVVSAFPAPSFLGSPFTVLVLACSDSFLERGIECESPPLLVGLLELLHLHAQPPVVHVPQGRSSRRRPCRGPRIRAAVS